MPSTEETSTSVNTMAPVEPYSHIAKVEQFITIGATAGADPASGELMGPDIESQTMQVIDTF